MVIACWTLTDGEVDRARALLGGDWRVSAHHSPVRGRGLSEGHVLRRGHQRWNIRFSHGRFVKVPTFVSFFFIVLRNTLQCKYHTIHVAWYTLAIMQDQQTVFMQWHFRSGHDRFFKVQTFFLMLHNSFNNTIQISHNTCSTVYNIYITRWAYWMTEKLQLNPVMENWTFGGGWLYLFLFFILFLFSRIIF